MLQEAVNVDNHAFGLEVPLEASNWNLPDIDPNFATVSLPNSSVYDPPLPPPRHPSTIIRATSTGTGLDIEPVELIPDDELVEDEIDEILLDDDAVPTEGVLRIRGGGDIDSPYDEDDDDNEGMDEDEVELGCLRKISSTWDVDFDVGKVGGLPKWIDPSSPLCYAELACKVCSKTMVLLLQVRSTSSFSSLACPRY